MKIFGIQRDFPELIEAQVAQTAKQVPYLYFILIANAVALAFTHYGTAPDWITLYMLAAFILVSIYRAFYWLRQGKGAFELESGVRNLTGLFRFSIILCTIMSLWSYLLYQYGGETQQAHVAYFMSITVIGCSVCLMQFPPAAYATLLIAGSATVLFFSFSGNTVFIAMSGNLLIVSLMLFKVINTYFSAFSGQVATRRELLVLNDRVLMASRAKTEFLASMSHEIRTPLNGILGMAQVLEQEALSPQQREMVATIRDSGRILTAILNDVLDLSKIEAGRVDISPVDADLPGILHGLHRLFAASAQKKSLRCDLFVDPAIPDRLSFDAVRVQQCLSNLISNAIKFTERGVVRIGATISGDAALGYLVRVQVTDTGIGVSEREQTMLFQPFTQADSSTTRRFGGTGLGLAITKKLARLMDGDVVLESKEGMGSTFTLTFRAEAASGRFAPGAKAALPAARAGPAGRRDLHGRRILLVDDNAINRKVARAFLAPYDMVITEAQNGREALEKLDGARFDLVVLDVHMPVMDGIEAIRLIRAGDARWNQIPVIALTADAMSGDRERYLAMGMTSYISKPIQREMLLSEIRRLLSDDADMPQISEQDA